MLVSQEDLKSWLRYAGQHYGGHGLNGTECFIFLYTHGMWLKATVKGYMEDTGAHTIIFPESNSDVVFSVFLPLAFVHFGTTRPHYGQQPGATRPAGVPQLRDSAKAAAVKGGAAATAEAAATATAQATAQAKATAEAKAGAVNDGTTGAAEVAATAEAKAAAVNDGTTAAPEDVATVEAKAGAVNDGTTAAAEGAATAGE